MDIGFNLLRASIEKHEPLTEEQFAEICKYAVLKRYKKGQFLVHQGSVMRKTHFIINGSALAYFIDHQGAEYVIQFAIEGWWISDIHSYVSGKPAINFVQAFEDCELFEFQFEDLKKLYQKIPALESYFLTITQNAFAAFQERILFNLSLSAEDRYLKCIEKYPFLEKRFTQKQIASYLGMSAEFYSKIKKRQLEK